MSTRARSSLVLRSLAAAALLLVLGGTAGLGETPETAGEELVGSDVEIAASLLNRIEARWWRRQGLEEKGDLAGAAEAGEDLAQFLADEGVERLEPMASAAVWGGNRRLERGDLAAAVQDYRFARKLDRLQAAAWWGEARANLKKGQWGEVFRLGWRAITTRWRSFWSIYGTLVDFGAVLWAGALLAGLLALIMLLVRHGPELVREVDSHLPTYWHGSWRTSLGWTFLLSPLALLFIGIWSVFLWAMALVPACSSRERRLIYLWLLIVALTAPVLGGLWLMAGVAGSPTAQVAVASVEGSLRPDLLIQLATLADAHPDEATWKVLLAQILAPRYPNRAVPLLREASELDSRDPRIPVALGNVLFRVGKFEAAGVQYRRALDLDPRNVLALFNQWKVRAATFDFEKATAALLRARKIDPDLVDELEERTSEEGVADPTFTVREVAKQVLADELRPGLRRVMRPDSPITLAALGALLGAWVLRVRSGRLEMRRCETCGRAASLRSGEMTDSGVCLACTQLFSRREGLAPSARQEQAGRIDLYLRRVGRGRTLLHLLCPGLALIHEGRPWLGALCSWAWLTLLLAGLFPEALLPMPASSTLWPPGLVFLLGAGLVWIVCQFPPLRPRPLARRGGR